eukprot:504286_1
MRASRRLLQCVHQTKILSRNIHLTQQLLPTLSHSNNYTFKNTNLFRSFCTSSSNNNDDNKTDDIMDEMNDDMNEEKEAEPIPELKPTMNETVEKDHLQKHAFQAETRQLLDIVSHSLYTDKEVFLRELLSNASDSLEKVRYNITKDNTKVIETELPLEINVYTDKEKGQIIIEDTGIGMNESELIDNIGTIARSGSKAFVRSLAETPSDGTSAVSKGEHIIGQFGVGFYSVFMVSDNVEVYSLSAMKDNKNDIGHWWQSDGTGSYNLATANNVNR